MNEDEALFVAAELVALRAAVTYLLRPESKKFKNHAVFSKTVLEVCGPIIDAMQITPPQLDGPVREKAKQVLSQMVDRTLEVPG